MNEPQQDRRQLQQRHATKEDALAGRFTGTRRRAVRPAYGKGEYPREYEKANRPVIEDDTG